MASVKANKRRGFGYEGELVKEALAAGLDARRAWGSNGESLGHHAEVDLVVSGQRIQAKRRKALSSFLKPSEHVDAVVTRWDAKPGERRPESLAVIPWSVYLELIRRDQQLKTLEIVQDLRPSQIS